MTKQKTLAIIGIISVLAILVVGVLSMAGAVTRVTPTSMKGGIEVYTKAEIDAFMRDITARLNKLEGNNPPVGLTCSRKNMCARILKVSRIDNSSSGYSNDKITLNDVKDGSLYQAVLTQEGAGTIVIDGKVYNLIYSGASNIPENDKYITIYQDVRFYQKAFWNGYILIDIAK